MEIKIPQNSIRKLKSLGVGVVYLFGSEAQGTTHFDSDINIGVVFLDPAKLEDTGRRLKLYNELDDIFTEAIPYRHIDTVLLQTTSLSLQYEAIRPGKVIYETSPEFRGNYEEALTKFYLDFKPLLDIQHRAVLERIK
ncbi:MAG: nucleotidyltransferase domain-containing protein [Patescibacteria group bacterium]